MRTIKYSFDFGVAEEGQEATETSHSMWNYSWRQGRKCSQIGWPNTGRSCSETLWYLIFGSGTRIPPEVLLYLLFCGSMILWKSLSKCLTQSLCFCKASETLPRKCLFIPFRNKTPSRFSITWSICHSCANFHPSPHAQLTLVLPLSSCMWKWLQDPSPAENICFNEETEMYMKTHKKVRFTSAKELYRYLPVLLKRFPWKASPSGKCC